MSEKNRKILTGTQKAKIALRGSEGAENGERDCSKLNLKNGVTSITVIHKYSFWPVQGNIISQKS